MLADLGISYHFYENTGDKKKTFRSVATIQHGKEDDLCYCSFDDEAISVISKSNAGIVLCKNGLKEFIDQNYVWMTIGL